MGTYRVRFAVGVAAFVAIACNAFALQAAEVTPAASNLNRVYFFTGADIGNDTGFGWAGLTAAPFGKLDEDGMRLRVLGGFGQYRYHTQAVPGGENEGSISSGEILIGRRLLFDPVTITAYAGLDVRNYRLQHPDPGNPESGERIGIKAALEIYARIAPKWFATGYANISSIFQNYSVRAAINRELTSTFALGIEGALLGDTRYNEQRAGLIASMKFARNIITVASGIVQNSDKGSGEYATLTLYSPF